MYAWFEWLDMLHFSLFQVSEVQEWIKNVICYFVIVIFNGCHIFRNYWLMKSWSINISIHKMSSFIYISLHSVHCAIRELPVKWLKINFIVFSHYVFNQRRISGRHHNPLQTLPYVGVYSHFTNNFLLNSIEKMSF